MVGWRVSEKITKPFNDISYKPFLTNFERLQRRIKMPLRFSLQNVYSIQGIILSEVITKL